MKSASARLKSLELQGYKTFASKNAFGFSPSITAIVGPNGSGKSNITDAIRWVLGEQSFNLLRGKRTEDMIFAGSDNRARASMASAMITFDNEDGWLPIDFSEVTIGRRAFRDGQNEYILNGQKVRLRDVNELLSKTGLSERTYTIIGQGLVDAALSLRADQRRQLFEEAAGIGLYRSRREEALRRLDTTRRNLERVQDILAELRPRVRSLKRQVDRSKDYDQVRDDLQELLRIWYGYHWYALATTVGEGTALAEQHGSRREILRQEQSQTESKLRSIRASVDQLRDQLRSWSLQTSAIHLEREGLGREQAIGEERQRWLVEQIEQYQAEIEELEQTSAGFREEMQAVDSQVEASKAALDESRSGHAKLIAEGEVASGDRERLRLDADRTRGALEALAARVAVWESRREHLLAGKLELKTRLEGARAELGSARERAAPIDAAVEETQSRLEALESSLQKINQDLQSGEQRITASRDALASAEVERNKLVRLHSELSAQVEVFESTHSNSRRMLEAWKDGGSSAAPGLIGSLGDTLIIDKEYRVAILAALGEFRDGLAFEQFDQVMKALEHPLISQGETRAAFLAADWRREYEALPVPDHPGCLGLALDYVKVRGASVELLAPLLGRTLVVRDRATARALLPGLPEAARLVTLTGDVFLPSGQVLAGFGLQAERELKQTESAVRELGSTSGNLRQVEDRISGLQEAAESHRQQLIEWQAERSDLLEQLGPARQAANEAGLNQATARAELSQRQVRLNDLEGEFAKLEADLEVLQGQEQDIEQQRKRMQDDYRAAATALEAIQLSDRMLEAEAALERLRGELEAAVTMREGLEARLGLLKRDVDLRRARIESNDAELAALRERAEKVNTDLREVDARLSALEGEMRPAEEALAAAERSRSELEHGEVDLRSSLQAIERDHAQVQIALARKQEELTSLQRRIVDDFGLVAFDESDDLTSQEPLPLEGIVERLTRVEELPQEIEGQVKQLRMQLRRMGPVNPEARREYKEVGGRVEFLTAQVDDLRKAEAQIHEVIAELDVLMEREFRVTYEAVAAAFKESFTRLFGGGSARLELTEPDDLTQSGIDIEARLPGRRMQGLAMLSGGERSLTACALIFALLKVSPTPFCVLDEVDAMLDETNVLRFIEMLKELSKETQFILITHNRLTVQSAEVVYGISMGSDTASKVISMNLEEAANQIAAD